MQTTLTTARRLTTLTLTSGRLAIAMMWTAAGARGVNSDPPTLTQRQVWTLVDAMRPRGRETDAAAARRVQALARRARTVPALVAAAAEQNAAAGVERAADLAALRPSRQLRRLMQAKVARPAPQFRNMKARRLAKLFDDVKDGAVTMGAAARRALSREIQRRADYWAPAGP